MFFFVPEHPQRTVTFTLFYSSLARRFLCASARHERRPRRGRWWWWWWRLVILSCLRKPAFLVWFMRTSIAIDQPAGRPPPPCSYLLFVISMALFYYFVCFFLFLAEKNALEHVVILLSLHTDAFRRLTTPSSPHAYCVHMSYASDVSNVRCICFRFSTFRVLCVRPSVHPPWVIQRPSIIDDIAFGDGCPMTIDHPQSWMIDPG